MSAETKTLSALRSRRNLQARLTFQRRHAQFPAKRRLPWGELHLVNQVVAFNGKIRVARQSDSQKKVPALTAAGSRLALASESDSLSLVYALRNFNLIAFHLVRISSTQRDGPLRSVERFLECDHNVRFDITPSFGATLTLPEWTATKTGLASSAEKRFKEIAEPSPSEFKVDPATLA